MIPRKARLGRVVDFDEQHCHMTHLQNYQLARTTFAKPIVMFDDEDVPQDNYKFTVPGRSDQDLSFNNERLLGKKTEGKQQPEAGPAPLQQLREEFQIAKTDKQKAVPKNGIKLYSDNADWEQLQTVISKYPRIWESPAFAKICEDDWMPIPLIEDWQQKTKFTGKVYPLRKADRGVVDKTIDDLHQQDKMV